MSSSNNTSNLHSVIDEKPEDQVVVSSENDLAISNSTGKAEIVGSVGDDKHLAGSELGTVVEDASKYLSGQKRALLAISLALVVFIVGLVRISSLCHESSYTYLLRKDGTIVSTAVPTISNHFNSLRDVGWYGSAL